MKVKLKSNSKISPKLVNIGLNKSKNKSSKYLKISRSKRLSNKLTHQEMERISRDFKDERPPIDINLEKFLDDGGSSYIFYAGCPQIKGAYNSVVKMLKPEILKLENKKLSQYYINMINQEALTHKTISDHLPEDSVKVYKIGIVDGRTYILMERMNKLNFREVIYRQDKIEIKHKIEMLIRISEVLKNVHEIGYFHMDLKPENILLSKYSHLMSHKNGFYSPGEHFKIKLSDFGSSKPLMRDIRLEDNDILGTPNYMSPEQAMGSHHVDHRTDIFSFGIICYELLTGEEPRNIFYPINFDGSLKQKEMNKLIIKTEPKIRQFSQEYRPLEDLIIGCTQMNKENRIQTINYVHKELLKFYENSLI